MRQDLGREDPDFLSLIDLLDLAIFSLDREGCCLHWSRGAERLTGFCAEEVLGRPSELLDSELEDGLGAVAARLERPEEPDFVNGIVTLRRADGAIVTCLGDLRRTPSGGLVAGLTLFEPHLVANRRLARVVTPRRSALSELVGASPAMELALEELEQAAAVDVTVLIRGETGTGKELAARAIHAASSRRDRPLVCVNCSAIPEPLLESELFGHVKGAFTGATRDKPGVFEEAAGGVLFLDEIGDLGPRVQVKLLRALQEREIRRVGSSKTLRVDVRIVSATNRDLAAMVAAGEFREDLYYRIRVFELLLPPLRERGGDLPLLVDHFLAELSERHGKRVERVSPEALTCLQTYPWPGNVRELRNAIEHAFVTVRGEAIELRNLPAELRGEGALRRADAKQVEESPTSERERARIVAALREAGGKKTQAAELLGISRVTLWKKIKRLGINAVYLD